MQVIQQPGAGTDDLFTKALDLFRSGSTGPALETFEAHQSDDAWFLRAYPYLHEIRVGLMAALSPDSAEWQRVKGLDQAASERFNKLHEDPPIPKEEEHSIRGHGGTPESSSLGEDSGIDIDHIVPRGRRGFWDDAPAAESVDEGDSGGRRRREWSEPLGRPDAGEDRSEPPSPPAEAPNVERTPHIKISGTTPLEPGTDFGINVYLDSSAALKGEASQKVIAASGTAMVATIVTSAHFRLNGAENLSFVLDASEQTTSLPTVAASVAPIESWPDGAAFVGAIFFANGRACGQVTLQVEVKGAAAPTAAEPANVIVVPSNAGPVADLTVTILADPSHDGRSYHCSVSTPHIEKYRDPVNAAWNLQNQTQQLVSGFMARFTAPSTSREQLISELKGVGLILFDSSPDNFQEVFWALIDANAPLKSIAIVSAEPFVPWELMIPSRSLPTYTRRLPLGVEFNIGRWTDDKTIAPAWSLRITDSSVIAPAYSGTMILKTSLEEANMVSGQYPGDIIRPAPFAIVGKELGTVPRSLIHFICHGKDAATGIQSIRLDDNGELSSSNIRGIEGLGEIFAKTRPVVFLNACEVGRITPSLVGLGGFVASFIKLGATAVIAPLWSVEDSIAHEIATLFYQEVKANPGQIISEIFKKVRSKGYDPAFGRDTYVAYCFYGDPGARLATEESS